ncbi:NUDIX domain-containing protein [Candidatus Gottesmanbacteria bacterium]|nr:NUDIX domain-containing protein [Candidatus Gottesmanbacteria bacterium]
MKEERSSGGVVIRRGGSGWQVLLIRDMNGSWTFPKGLIEKGELPEQTAVREISEEVGIGDLTLVKKLSPIVYWYRRNGRIKKTVLYFLFTANSDKPLKPQKEEGIQEAKWTPLHRAKTIVGYPKTNRSLLQETILSL